MTPREHLSRIHELNCAVCRFSYGKFRPAHEAHHLQSVRDEFSDFLTVPLCHDCHAALHDSHRRAFHLAHKTDDLKLIAWTIKMLGEIE